MLFIVSKPIWTSAALWLCGYDIATALLDAVGVGDWSAWYACQTQCASLYVLTGLHQHQSLWLPNRLLSLPSLVTVRRLIRAV